METATLIDLKPSQAQTFLIPNCFNTQFEDSDIEMIALQTMAYTSLKDLIPSSSSPVIISPTSSRKDSWREIPIKDPLVQHAAWAYLQPMTSAPEGNDRSCFVKLVDCFREVFNGVVLQPFKGLFINGREEGEDEEEVGIGDEDDKVD